MNINLIHKLSFLALLSLLFFSSCKDKDNPLVIKNDRGPEDTKINQETAFICGMDIHAEEDPSHSNNDQQTGGQRSELTEYIPDAHTELKTICVNFHIMQDENGLGNWTVQHIPDLKQMLDWANLPYIQPDPTSDPIIGNNIPPIQDTRIRFKLNQIEFYRAPQLINSISTVDLFSEITARDPNFLNSVNIFFTNGSLQNAGAFATLPQTNMNHNSYVVMLGTFLQQPTSNYSRALLMAHELGHVLGLCHTFFGGNCNANCNTSDPDYLSDVFGTTSPNCPHLQGSGVDPFDNSIPNADRYTNNLMGESNSVKWISTLQAAKMHKSLATLSVARYIDNNHQCVSDDPTALYVSNSAKSAWELLTYSDYKLPQIKIGKLDNDDTDDVFIATGTEWRVAESTNNFAWKVIAVSTAGINQIELGDFDGDGRADIFFPTGTQWKVAESSNNYAWKVIATSGTQLSQLKLGDFDGDSITDIFWATGTEWRVAESSNGYAWNVIATSAVTQNQLELGDFDGDGKADVFFPTGTEWRVARSANNYAWSVIASSSTLLSQLLIGTFDTDNRADIFLATGTEWRLAKSVDNYNWQYSTSSGYMLPGITLGDFNGDRISDVIQ